MQFPVIQSGKGPAWFLPNGKASLPHLKQSLNNSFACQGDGTVQNTVNKARDGGHGEFSAHGIHWQ